MEQVPIFCHNGAVIRQSVAILHYIDQVFEGPSFYPKEPKKRAQVNEVCEIINSGIQPHQNFTTGLELQNQLSVSESDRVKWWCYWIKRGFSALDQVLEQTSGIYSVGDCLSAADFFVVPQAYNATRFGIDLSPYPHIARITQTCAKVESFQKAHPSQQPDAPAPK